MQGAVVCVVSVANTGDRPIQVGSHFHFYEVNPALAFDRAKAYGARSNIPAGTAVRFEPGEAKKCCWLRWLAHAMCMAITAKSTVRFLGQEALHDTPHCSLDLCQFVRADPRRSGAAGRHRSDSSKSNTTIQSMATRLRLGGAKSSEMEWGRAAEHCANSRWTWSSPMP
jgi:hypothetical protein